MIVQPALDASFAVAASELLSEAQVASPEAEDANLRTGRAMRLGERGANLVEYALLVAFIAIVCIAAVSALGSTTSEPFSELQSGIG